jgi:hypothetical protein
VPRIAQAVIRSSTFHVVLYVETIGSIELALWLIICMSYKQNRQARLRRRSWGFDARQVSMFSGPATPAGFFTKRMSICGGPVRRLD